MKGSLISLITVDYHYKPNRIAKIIKADHIKGCQGYGTTRIIHDSLFYKMAQLFQRTDSTLKNATCSRNTMPIYFSKRNKNVCPQKD